jgi:hypothetical protein
MMSHVQLLKQDRMSKTVTLRLDLTPLGKTRGSCEYFSVWSAGAPGGSWSLRSAETGEPSGRWRGSWNKLVTDCTSASR